MTIMLLCYYALLNQAEFADSDNPIIMGQTNNLSINDSSKIEYTIKSYNIETEYAGNFSNNFHK